MFPLKANRLSHLLANQVCIIGSGAAGLCAIRNFSRHLDKFDIEAFEKTNSVGGTWFYNEKREKDEFGLPIHSSMYANLRWVLRFKTDKEREREYGLYFACVDL